MTEEKTSDVPAAAAADAPAAESTQSSKPKKFPKALPHGAIEQIAPGLWNVSGGIRMMGIMRINRNMFILKGSNEELTVVNPVRLSEEGEIELKKLGEVKRILRLGFMHSRDDAYYKDAFGAELLCTGEGEDIDRVLSEGDFAYSPDASLFVFKDTNNPEGALLVRSKDEKILLTTDSLMHYGLTQTENYAKYMNTIAKLAMTPMGFFKLPIVVGPPWLKEQTPASKSVAMAAGGQPKGVYSLHSDFDRLLKLDFEQLLGAHGGLCKENAKGLVKEAVALAFPEAVKKIKEDAKQLARDTATAVVPDYEGKDSK